MIDLRIHQEPILSFLETELGRFRKTNPSKPVRHVALYGCPWSGWISLCLDSVTRPDQNCPDFEHVEVALYEAEDWAFEYDTAERPMLTRLDGHVVEIDVDSLGDDGFNRVFFDFLCDLFATPKALGVFRTWAEPYVRVGVQMLDSRFNRTWQPDAA